MSSEVLAISALAKNYGPVKALTDVSLRVDQGEIFGFLGPNGAGKTTTIRCLMDYIRPDKGKIAILGRDAQKDSTELKNHIGYLPSDSQLIEHWNTLQHVRFYQSLRKQGNSPLRELISALKLDPRQPVRQMSSGNRQKLGFILALVGSPELLILDEPTRGMDPLVQSAFYDILTSYTQQGGTVFLSSHNLSEVERMCSNVAIIRSGHIVADMSMRDIQAMKTHIITVTFANPANAASFRMPHAKLTSSGTGQLIIKTRGDISQILHVLLQYKLNDLEITHAPLEEVFMEYYK